MAMPLPALLRQPRAQQRPPQQPLPEQLTLDGFEDLLQDGLVRLRTERAAIAEGSHSANTRPCYESDWRGFAAWCAAHDATALPAPSQTIALYVTDCGRVHRYSAIAG